MPKKIKVKAKKQQRLRDFDIALQYFQSGNLQQAEMICRHILQQQPNYADAPSLPGLISYHAGQYDNAIHSVSFGS